MVFFLGLPGILLVKCCDVSFLLIQRALIHYTHNAGRGCIGTLEALQHFQLGAAFRLTLLLNTNTNTLFRQDVDPS